MKNNFSNQQKIMSMLNKVASPKKTLEEQDEPILETLLKEDVGTNVSRIGLNGIKLSADGTMSKVEYFNMLDINTDDYPDITFTDEEAKRISMSLRNLSTGVNAAVPMACGGSICPFESSCPYVAINKAPVGRSCLVESQLISFWTKQFIDEFDVDMGNFTELHLVSELAEFNIYELRVTKHLATKHQTLMQSVVTSVDSNGELIENEEISRAFDLKERIKKSRMKVLESLMATRKERVKISIEKNKGQSTTSKLTDLREKLEGYMKDIAKQEPVIEADIVDET